MPADTDDKPLVPLWIVGVAVAVGVVLRFAAQSPLWLDEALSVNIAEAANNDTTLSDLLRRDGHPPLYYWLLGIWTDLFGSGDWVVRALSGLLSVAALPFAYLLGRKVYGETTARVLLVVVALSPFALRYANETRMYALATLLAFAGWWAVERARRQPTIERLAVVSAVTAGLLYTHYWALWLLAAAGILLLIASAGHIESWNKTAARRLATALIVGGLAFVPWLGVLLDQAERTGTPWADPDRPTSDIVGLLFDLAGGKRSEAQLLAMVLVLLVVVAMFARVRSTPDANNAELIAGPLRHDTRLPLLITTATLAIGLAVGLISGSVFVPRYASVILPFVLALIAVGITRLIEYRPRVGQTALLLVGLVSILTATVELVNTRSQGEEVADFINAEAEPNDVVLFCPDQLGPATNRYIDDRITDQRVFPTQARPELVDWRDYAERNANAQIDQFVDEIIATPDLGTVWLVVATNYLTYEGLCEGLITEFGQSRDGVRFTASPVVLGRAQLIEAATLYRLSPVN